MTTRTIDALHAERDSLKILDDIEGTDFQPLLADKLRPISLSAVRDNYEATASPDGLTWPPRKRVGDGHPLLIDTGKMLEASTGGVGSVTHYEPDGMILGVDLDVVPYARAHNYGNPARNLPQREFLGLHDDAVEEAGEAVADFVEALI